MMKTNSNDGMRKLAEINVLSTEQTCEILNRTRQQVNNLVHVGDIIPLKKMSRCNLFWKPDILNYAEYKYAKNKDEHHEIIRVAPHKAITEFERLGISGKKIDEIFIYFDSKDAIEDNFFNLLGPTDKNTLIPVEAPTFVVICDSCEYWFSGINCGYAGVGPRSTEELLIHLGILIKEEEKVNSIISDSSIIYISRDNDEWTIETKESYFRNAEKEDSYGETLAHLYHYNQKLVLACENNNLFDCWNERTSAYLSRYADFMHSPTTIEFLSYEEALNSGHFTIIFNNTIVFQIIIRDAFGKELWLPHPSEERINLRNPSIQDVLCINGIELDKENFTEKVNRWLGIKVRLLNRIHRKKEN